MKAYAQSPHRVVAALAVAILVGGGCAPATSPSPSASGPTVSSSPAGPTATPEGPTEGGEASIVFADTFSHFNQLKGARNASFTLMTTLLHDMLFVIGPDNTYHPRLAESWDISPDARTYTFHLRKGVNWSDGEPFTSEDVKFTFEAYQDPEASEQSGKFTNVASFSAPDPETFVIELKEPNSGLFGLLAWPPLAILPEHILGATPRASMSEHEYFTAPNATMGPFKLVRFEADQFVELERNDNYWKTVHLDRLFVRQMEASVAVAAVEAGDVDITIVQGKDADRLDALPNVTVDSASGGGITLIVMQDELAPFDDKRVRQGLLYGIDRQGIIDVVFNGRGTIVNSHMRAPGTVPDDLEPYDYNPDKARELLDSANLDPNFVFRISWGSIQTERGEVATIVQSNLAEVGINVELAPAEGNVVIERLTNRTGEGTIIGGGIYTADGNSVNAPLSCDGPWPNGENFAHYCNREVDALLKQARETSDAARKLELYQEVARLTNEDVSHLWIAVPDSLYARNDRLQGYLPTGDTTTYGITAADWFLSE